MTRWLPLLSLVLLAPAAAQAADIAYVGSAGEPSAKVAEAMRIRVPGLDRSIPLDSVAAVAAAVRSGRAGEGLIPAITDDGMPAATADALLAGADPGLRIVGETRADRPDAGPIDYWVLAKPPERLAEAHPDRLALTLDAPEGSKAFSFVVAGLSKLGFTVTCLSVVPLPGKSFGFRYLVALAADKPVVVLRVTDAVAHDSRAGGGRAVLIGAWRQVNG